LQRYRPHVLDEGGTTMMGGRDHDLYPSWFLLMNCACGGVCEGSIAAESLFRNANLPDGGDDDDGYKNDLLQVLLRGNFLHHVIVQKNPVRS
jgi:hypothetical protein